MRIISGTAKGRPIEAPRGDTTRPTTDRIKESVFGIIQSEILDSQVLDLFAGSGNLGLEAVSRGASGCIFVDRDRTSIDIIQKNISKLGFISQTRVYHTDFKNALKQLHRHEEKFNLIFLDPPYNKGLLTQAVPIIIELDLLDEAGLIVAEHSSKEFLRDERGIYKIKDRRHYGNTAVSFIQKDVTED